MRKYSDMQKKFLATILYSFYLILLGQGCSVLNNDELEQEVEVSVLDIPKAITLPALPKIEVSEIVDEAPEELETVVKQAIPARLELPEQEVILHEVIKQREVAREATLQERNKLKQGAMVQNALEQEEAAQRVVKLEELAQSLSNQNANTYKDASQVKKEEVQAEESERAYEPSRYRVIGFKRTPSIKTAKKVIKEKLADLEITPIEKEIKIVKSLPVTVGTESSDIELSIEDLNENSEAGPVGNLQLNDKPGFEHSGFEVEVSESLASTDWMAKFSDTLDTRLAAIDEESQNEVIAEASPSFDYQPNSKVTVENFVNDEEDFSDIIKKTDSSLAKADDLVFLEYSKAEEAPQPAAPQLAALDSQPKVPTLSLATPANSDISSVVRSVIDREMAGSSTVTDHSRLIASATRMAAKSAPSNQPSGYSSNFLSDIGMNKSRNRKKKRRDKRAKKLKNQATLYAMEADLEKGFQDEVRNFDFIPGHNSNESLRDFNEGHITVDYSLVNQGGVLRGTILKNFFMRTTFEIPLGSEYSKFEIPLIPKDSLGEYLDKNELEGYGGFFLVDLGDMIEDVDVEKTTNDKVTPYEHRLFLNSDFKPVKAGGDYRYILFIVVIPGSVNVRYLGVNGQETSNLAFITADEVNYDFSQIERPHLLSFRTRVRNTLGMSTSPIDLRVSDITSFIDEAKPTKTSESSFEIKIPWSVRGMRNYFRFDYLQDDIFVGVDRDQEIELPSKEFIGEILRSFNMDSLGAECVLQMNFSTAVSKVEIQAESEKGPSNFEHTYLDRDGVFTPEISPLSQKFFAVGYEEGIFSIKVSYEDGRSDYLRTYCSPSTYLLEQL